jgi:hypothetical protein
MGSDRPPRPRIRFTIGQIMLWAGVVALVLAVILHPENPFLNMTAFIAVSITLAQFGFDWLFSSGDTEARPPDDSYGQPLEGNEPIVAGEPGLVVAYATADGLPIPVELLDLQITRPPPDDLPSLFLEYDGDRPMLVEETDCDLRRLDILDRGPILAIMDRRWPVLVLPIATDPGNAAE